MAHPRIAGIIAAAVLGLPLAGRSPAFAGDAGAPPAAEPPACAECHEEEAEQWKISSHSRAMKPEFLAEWERQGKKWECLVCHTSRFDRKTGEYSKDGVNCESCHGAAKPDHPDKQRMAMPTGSDSCRDCHSITYAEWRLSAHGQKNIGCTSCHAMHAMELRKEDPDQQCGSCHTERLKDFAHATHRVKGLHCTSCHMPEPTGTHSKIKGTGVRGHSYGVGAETCAGCHRVQVHQSGEMAALKTEVKSLRDAGLDETMAKIPALQLENSRLQENLRANKVVFPWVAALSFLLGVGLGVGLARMIARPAPAPAEGGPVAKPAESP